MRTERRDAEGLRLPAERVPAPGEIISNRYRVVRQENQSGCCSTLIALDTRERREVRLRLLKTPDARLRAARFRDTVGPWPRIVDLCEWRGDALVVEELPEGLRLVELIPPEGTLATRYCLATIYQTLKALEFANAQGVHHGCLTLESLFIRCSGEVMLLDWEAGEAVSATRETDFAAVSRVARTLLAPADGGAIADPVIQVAMSRLLERPWRSGREGCEEVCALFERVFSRPLKDPQSELLPLVAVVDSSATVGPRLGRLVDHPIRGARLPQAGELLSLAGQREPAVHTPSEVEIGTTVSSLNGGPPLSPLAATFGGRPDPAMPVVQSSDAIGDLLHGRYRLIRELGRGGMGRVFEAADTKLHRNVALKLLEEAEGHNWASATALSEARAVASLRHPNIVVLYDADVIDGQAYVSMELVDGVTLRERIRTGLSIRGSLEILSAVASGLLHAHREGVVHRDVKPENVMVTREGTAKVLDFGIALTPETSAEPVAPAGTVRYMAPELFRGSKASRASDIYAFGVMALEVLESAAQKARASGKHERRLRQKAPLATALFQRCAHPNSAERLNDLREVVSSLSALLNDKRPTASYLALGGAAALLVTAFVSLPRTLRSEPAPVRQSWVESAEPGSSELLRSARWHELRRRLHNGTSESEPASINRRLLRFSITEAYDEAARQDAAALRNARDALTEEQSRVFFVLEPLANAPADYAESAMRARALMDDPPSPVARAVAARVLALAPASNLDGLKLDLEWAAAELSLKALSHERNGRHADAIRLYLQCTREHGAASDCRRGAGRWATAVGAFDELEKVARGYIAAAPSETEGYRLLSNALLHREGTTTGPLELMEPRLRNFPEPSRELIRLFGLAALAAWDGDFTSATSYLDQYESRAALVPGEQSKAYALRLRAAMALEGFEPEAFRRYAISYLGRSAAWKRLDGPDFSIVAKASLYRLRFESRSEYATYQTRWLQEHRGRSDVTWGMIWSLAYGQAARTREDALEALAAARSEGTFGELLARDEYSVARVLELAGREAEALPVLRRAVRKCSLSTPVEQTAGLLLLSDLERRHNNHDSACQAAGVLVRRWASHSRETAKVAVARMAEMRCRETRAAALVPLPLEQLMEALDPIP